jgi:alpha-L-rhamnosidase
MGESYDARREIPGWNLPDFDDTSWYCVATFPDPGIAIVAQQGPLVHRIQELKPIAEPTRTFDSGYIYDLGQNITGRVRLKVSGPKGTTIRLRFAEMLKPDGTIYSENLRLARATDYYTLKGDSEEVYEPRFTFHGFRYAEVSGLPGEPGPDMVTGIVIHSAIPPTGTFECSDPLINQLQHNIQWSQKDNFLEIPTDCPQRDERLGWTGDAQVFIRTAAFNMNIAGFFTKWLDDMVTSQSREGWIPKTIPNIERDNKDAGPAWADALMICPWTLYLCYGDTHLLEKHYTALKRFVDYLNRTSQREIRCHPSVDPWGGFGDWLALDGSGKTEGGTSKDLIGTAFFAYSARLMANIAQVLGKDNDVEYYVKMSERVHEAFNRRFVTQEGLIVSQTQTAYVLALHFDLLPEELRPAAVDTLVNDIERRDWHLSTGFVGSPYLLHVLTRFGRLDVAYKLLFQKTWPSWLYAVTQGATTIWERWDGWTHDRGFQDPGMNSFNHYAYGAIGDWLYAVVAGINVDPARPGYKHIIFHAQPGGSLTSAKATLNSIYGLIVSDWRIVDNQFAWDIVVPPNTTATILLPGTIASLEVEAGKYHFTKDWHESVNGR